MDVNSEASPSVSSDEGDVHEDDIVRVARETPENRSVRTHARETPRTEEQT
jgi:hypothetical protein